MVYWSAVRDISMSPPVLTEESMRRASTRESVPLDSIRSRVITFTVCGTSSVFMFVSVAVLTVSARRDLERMGHDPFRHFLNVSSAAGLSTAA